MKLKQQESLFKILSVILLIVVVGLVIAIYNFDNSNDDIKQDINEVEKKMVDNPVVVFETSMGNFEVELFLDKSPITAGNFKELVESGFYDGIKFHRVIKDFMVQSGDPLSKNDSLKKRWGTGGSEPIEDEFIRGLSNVRGTLSMANAGPNTGSSQFFINVVDNTFLDWDKKPLTSKHPVFGQVISGMEVVDKMSVVATEAADRPKNNIVIKKAYIK